MISLITPRGRVLAAAAAGFIALFAAGCSAGGGAASTPAASATTPTSAAGSGPVAPAESAAPTTPPAGSSGAAGPAECSTGDLRVTTGNANGAAGTIYYDVEFTNTSAAACVLRGYPGVSLVSAPSNAGSQVGADAKRTARYASDPVTLGAGQTANAKLGVAEAGNFPVSSCNPVTAHFMKVFPPDQTVAAYLPFTTQTCASTSQPTMTITAVISGR